MDGCLASCCQVERVLVTVPNLIEVLAQDSNQRRSQSVTLLNKGSANSTLETRLAQRYLTWFIIDKGIETFILAVPR